MYGDAAEQVVRLSLEGMEVTAKITGEAAKDIGVLLATVMKEEHKTKGKARLSTMIRSGKELKVFTVQQKDLKKFASEANRYGVLYCVLKEKDNSSPTASVDIIARAEDASKIQRIMDRFGLSTVKRGTVVTESERENEAPEKDTQAKENKSNPESAKTDKSPLSERNSEDATIAEEGISKQEERPSVRKKLQECREIAAGRSGDKLLERKEIKRDAR